MKTLTINLANGEKIMLVEVPDGKVHWSKHTSSPESINWQIFKTQDEWLLNFHGDKGLIFNERLGQYCKLQDRCEILGTYTSSTGEIDFEVPQNFVESKLLYNVGAKEDRYYFRNYSERTSVSNIGEPLFKFDTAKESFLSLLKSETEKAFPLKENPYVSEKYPAPVSSELTDWQTAESQTMPKRFCVIKIQE